MQINIQCQHSRYTLAAKNSSEVPDVQVTLRANTHPYITFTVNELHVAEVNKSAYCEWFNSTTNKQHNKGQILVAIYLKSGV